jgi:hypothetical protein
VDGVPDQVKGATISLVGTPAGGYIPMSVVPVIRCGEFVTSELAQAQAERCNCLTRGVPYVLTASVHRRHGNPCSPAQSPAAATFNSAIAT